MSVLDAFFLNWQKARETFGEGAPQTGERFDHSALFRELEARLETTAPGDQWSGTAADADDAVNTEHRRVIGELANLDQRLGAEVTRSAQIVTAGRNDLQTVRDAVAAVADRLPAGPSGDAMRYALVSQGTGQVNEIIRRSSSELSTVGADLLALNDEYSALSNQKFGGLKENDPEDLLEGEDDGDKADQELDADRRRNQINAFRQVFGREPVSTVDWKTAAALDPHSYDAKFRGVPPEILVAQIDPVPGQGVVRISQWIEQRDVFGWPDITDTSELPPSTSTFRKRQNA